jgi:hypothetical protein
MSIRWSAIFNRLFESCIWLGFSGCNPPILPINRGRLICIMMEVDMSTCLFRILVACQGLPVWWAQSILSGVLFRQAH